MSKGTLHLASRHVSVVDDVDDELAEDDAVSELAVQKLDVIDLGDGYVELNGTVFYEDWDEIDPPGSDDEPGIPHEVVMAEIWAMLKKPVRARR